MQKQLKLKVRAGSSEEAREEWLARFVRTLEVGRSRTRLWDLRALDDSEGRFGWEARADGPDRTQRLILSAAGDLDLAAAEWTLTVESGPPEAAPPALRGGEWWVGLALGIAAFLVVRAQLGTVPGVAAGLGLLLIC